MDARYATREMKEIGHDPSRFASPFLSFLLCHLVYDLLSSFIAFICILRTNYYMFSPRLPQ